MKIGKSHGKMWKIHPPVFRSSVKCALGHDIVATDCDTIKIVINTKKVYYFYEVTMHWNNTEKCMKINKFLTSLPLLLPWKQTHLCHTKENGTILRNSKKNKENKQQNLKYSYAIQVRNRFYIHMVGCFSER